jgi:F-type H+-transporting ATPase subunit gamma
MPSLKDVQLKIQGVKKTKQITKAMNMVATSRLRGAQGAMDGFRPYAEKFSEVLGSLAEKAGEEASPLLIPKEEVKKIHIVLCTSDRGLCGGFNINITDGAKNHIKNYPIEDAEYSLTCFGKKGRDWARKAGHTITEEHLGVVGSKFGFSIAATAGKKLVDGFLGGDYDEVFIIYSEFVSMAKQLPVVQKLLPIPPIEKDETEEGDSEAIILLNTSVNPHRKNCLAICCRETYMFRFTGHCWKHQPVNTLRG